MSDMLPQELLDEMAKAHTKGRRKRATRSIHVGDEAFPILDMAEEGFTVLVEETPHLRGLVHIFEGSRHLYQALIVAASQEGDLMRYEFKRNTVAASSAPLDFERPEGQPVPLLSRA